MKTIFCSSTAARWSAWSTLWAAAALVGCSTKPPLPDWQLQSHASLQRATAAYLQGDDRVAGIELALARKHLSSTGRPDLLANAELVHCAARAASLILEDCTGFAPLRPDATPAQRAYADYLRGQVTPVDRQLLPPAQRTVMQSTTPDATTQAIAAIGDPLSKLLAAALVLQAGNTTPAMLALAVETASAQGWRRPLLAWLGMQAQRAEQAGQADEALKLRRRMDLVEGKH